MAFDNNNNNDGGGSSVEQVAEMSTLKADDSPQQQINEQSLAQDLEKNRESLKRKLQTRRSLKQLVDVGIMPPPKAPLPFYEQRKQLQMRKTQDILRNKIVSRPDRQLLIEHNILSDTIAAPAIQNTQRQLKRARLADNLNDKLAARPGVLELVASNILEIDQNVKEAIQGGRIKFRSTKTPSTSIFTTPIYCTEEQQTSSYSQLFTQSSIQSQRLLLPKTSASTVASSSTTTTTTSRRSSGSSSKAKSSLTFHEYKGPSQKAEVTKMSLQPPLLPAPLIVQPVQATLVPLVPLQDANMGSENHYHIQLQQQELFLELLHNDENNDNLNPSFDENGDHDNENPIANLLQQPIDESILSGSLSDEQKSFETMKLVDLKSQCRKLNISSTGTKMQLIARLKNVRVKVSDMSNGAMIDSSSSQIESPSPSSVSLLLSTSLLNHQELYQQQQRKIAELESQLQKLKQIDPASTYHIQSPHIVQPFDNTIAITPKCNPILSVQIQKRILMQQQEKLKQKLQNEQQPMVTLTPESVAQFLANQAQSLPPIDMEQEKSPLMIAPSHPSDNHHWSLEIPNVASTASSCQPFVENGYFNTFQSTNIEPKLVDDNDILSLLDDYTGPTSMLRLCSDDSLLPPPAPAACVSSSSPSTAMDWMGVSTSSATVVDDLYDENNSDFTQFLNQFGNDHHLLFDPPLSTCQSNSLPFDFLSPSSPMI